MLVRDVMSPGQSLNTARVFPTMDGNVPPGTVAPFVATDSTGRAELDLIPSSTRYVLIRALAYQPVLVPVLGVPGCTVYLEVYLTPDPFCTANCPDTPPRATVTTCRPDA